MSRANVVPFPRRDPPPFADQADGGDRLRQSLARLQAALAAQQQAVQGWRATIADLNIGVAALGHSLERYRASLGGLQGSASELGAKARMLEVWAEPRTPK